MNCVYKLFVEAVYKICVYKLFIQAMYISCAYMLCVQAVYTFRHHCFKSDNIPRSVGWPDSRQCCDSLIIIEKLN